MNREDKKQAALGYVFLLPSLVMFAVFMFYPLFYTLYLSFFEWNMVKPVKKFVETQAGVIQYKILDIQRVS